MSKEAGDGQITNGQILSQVEIDSLIGALTSGQIDINSSGRDRVDTRAVRVYDFRRPDRFSKEQLRTLQMIHDTCARLFTTTLAAYLRTVVQVSVDSVDNITYAEFVELQSNPGVIAVVSLSPLPGRTILSLTPGMSFALVDRLFGGPGQLGDQKRALTDIEQTVMRRVLAAFLRDLAESWRNISELRPTLDGMESNPLFTQVVAPTEMCIAIRFSVDSADFTGKIELCLPYPIVEPVLSKLSERHWFTIAQRDQREDKTADLLDNIMNARVTVQAILGQTQLSIGDLMELRRGDVIPLGKNVGVPIVLRVGGQPRFTAVPGKAGKNMAVLIDREMDPGQEEISGE